MTAQEKQNLIYRKMSAKKKAEITFSFSRLGKFLNSLNNESSPRTNKFSKNS